MPVKTILLVEDELAAAELLQMLFEDSGYVLLTAGTVHEAEQLWKRCGAAIDLVITDLNLDGDRVAGFRLTEAWQHENPDLKVLYTSGFSRDCIPIGDRPGTVFLPKPYHPSVLLDNVAHLLWT